MTYPIYEQVTPTLGAPFIRATLEGNVLLLIPMDEANADYQGFLEWLAEGNEPDVITE